MNDISKITDILTLSDIHGSGYWTFSAELLNAIHQLAQEVCEPGMETTEGTVTIKIFVRAHDANAGVVIVGVTDMITKRPRPCRPAVKATVTADGLALQAPAPTLPFPREAR